MRTLALAAAAVTACDCFGQYKAFPYPPYAWQHVKCGVSRGPMCTDGKTVPKTVGKCLTPSQGFTVIFVTTQSKSGKFKNAFAIEGHVDTASGGHEKTRKPALLERREPMKYDARGLKLLGECKGREHLTKKDGADCLAECPDGQVKPVTLARYVVVGNTWEGLQRRFTMRAIVDCDADKMPGRLPGRLLDTLRDHGAIDRFLTLFRPSGDDDSKLVARENLLPQPLQAARHEPVL